MARASPGRTDSGTISCRLRELSVGWNGSGTARATSAPIAGEIAQKAHTALKCHAAKRADPISGPVAVSERPLHVVRQHREDRPHGHQSEERRGEDPRDRAVGGASHRYREPSPRSCVRLIFPLAVFGSSSANSTIRGHLYGAVT